MGKLAQLKKATGGNVKESLGAGAKPRPVALVSKSGPDQWKGTKQNLKAMLVPVAKIKRDRNQPREEFDAAAITRLASSLKQHGQVQPIRVRWDEGEGSYMIICGERRWRAAQEAGLEMLDVVVMDEKIGGLELLALQLVENCLREDLTPIEQAKGFRSYMHAKKCSARELARELGLDHSAVVRAMQLLELPPPVQALVDAGKIPPTTAHEITKVPPAEQAPLAQRVVEEKLTGADVKRERKGVFVPGTNDAEARKRILTLLKPSSRRWTREELKPGLTDLGRYGTDVGLQRLLDTMVREGILGGFSAAGSTEFSYQMAGSSVPLDKCKIPAPVKTKTYELEVNDRTDTAIVTLCCPVDWSANQRAGALRAAAEQVWAQERGAKAAKSKPKAKVAAPTPFDH
jgi:ParB family chromosome partitioning protein